MVIHSLICLDSGSGLWHSLDSEEPCDCGDGTCLGLSQNRPQLQISAHGIDLCFGCTLRCVTVDLNWVNTCHRELVRLRVHLAQAMDSLGPSPAFPYAFPLARRRISVSPAAVSIPRSVAAVPRQMGTPSFCGDGTCLGLSQNRPQLQISAHGIDLCFGCTLRCVTVDLNWVNTCHRELVRLRVHLAQAMDSLGPSPAFPYAFPLARRASPFPSRRFDSQIRGCCPQTDGCSVILNVADDQFPKGFVVCQKRGFA